MTAAIPTLAPTDAARLVTIILDELERAVVGKRDVLELVVLGLLADGHVLLDDLPGVAKTLTARSLARVTGLSFSRIQFTPDLLPADITGATVFDAATADFTFRPGPVFGHLVLGDEINRAPAKTQAALLEAMQERQVTVDGVTHPLPQPFLVVATQNPIEHEGTYALPEAQLDRFLLRIRFGYPGAEDETELLARRVARGRDEVELDAVCGREGDPGPAGGRRAGPRRGRRGPLRRRPGARHPGRRRGRGRRQPSRLAGPAQAGASPGPGPRPGLRRSGRREGGGPPRAGSPHRAAERGLGAGHTGRVRDRAGRGVGPRTILAMTGPGAVLPTPKAAPPAVGASPRLAAYAGVGSGALVVSLLAARPALAAFGAPLLLMALVGVCLAHRPALTLQPPRITPEQAIAGDQLSLEVELDVQPAVSRVDVLLAIRGPVGMDRPRSGPPSWALVGAGPECCRGVLSTRTWGRVSISAATVRAYGPLGLVHWTWTIPAAASARVLPRPERLRTLLDAPPRAAAGIHTSTAKGGGLDFAELRALAPGDRLTDVSWRASARRGDIARGELLVNVRHPERAGDVVLLLDTSSDDHDEQAPWLPRAARAAWALAQAHLQSHDRVGLVSFGGYISWVTMGSGERAAYAILDKLLAVRPSASANRSLTWLPLAAAATGRRRRGRHPAPHAAGARRAGRAPAPWPARVGGGRGHVRPRLRAAGPRAGRALLGAGARSPGRPADARGHRHHPLVGRPPAGAGRGAAGPGRPRSRGTPTVKTLRRTSGASASPRLRAVAALTGLLATVLLVGRVASTTGEGARVGLVVGAVAFILQVVSVLVWPAATGPAAGLLGLLAGAALLPAANRGLAVEMVVLFLASVELTTWAARLRSVVPETGASIRRQLGEVGAVRGVGRRADGDHGRHDHGGRRAEWPRCPRGRAGRRPRAGGDPGLAAVAHHRAVRAGAGATADSRRRRVLSRAPIS